MAVSKGNKRKRAKQTGVLSRLKTNGGKKVLARRRRKGRARLGA